MLARDPTARQMVCFISVDLALLLAGMAEGCKVFKADTAFLCLANGQPGKYNGVSRTIVPLASNEGRSYVKIIEGASSRGLAWCTVR